MARTFILMIISILPLTVHCQTYNSFISDKEIEDFLTAKLNDSSSASYLPSYYSKSILLWSDEYLDYSDTSHKMGLNIYDQKNPLFDTIISLEDKIFISQQAYDLKIKFWQTNQISFVKNKRKGISYISVPLFTKNKQFAIVRQHYKLNKESGYKNVIIYKRIPNGWKYYGYLTGGVY